MEQCIKFTKLIRQKIYHVWFDVQNFASQRSRQLHRRQ